MFRFSKPMGMTLIALSILCRLGAEEHSFFHKTYTYQEESGWDEDHQTWDDMIYWRFDLDFLIDGDAVRVGDTLYTGEEVSFRSKLTEREFRSNGTAYSRNDLSFLIGLDYLGHRIWPAAGIYGLPQPVEFRHQDRGIDGDLSGALSYESRVDYGQYEEGTLAVVHDVTPPSTPEIILPTADSSPYVHRDGENRYYCNTLLCPELPYDVVTEDSGSGLLYIHYGCSNNQESVPPAVLRTDEGDHSFTAFDYLHNRSETGRADFIHDGAGPRVEIRLESLDLDTGDRGADPEAPFSVAIPLFMGRSYGPGKVPGIYIRDEGSGISHVSFRLIRGDTGEVLSQWTREGDQIHFTGLLRGYDYYLDVRADDFVANATPFSGRRDRENRLGLPYTPQLDEASLSLDWEEDPNPRDLIFSGRFTLDPDRSRYSRISRIHIYPEGFTENFMDMTMEQLWDGGGNFSVTLEEAGSRNWFKAHCHMPFPITIEAECESGQTLTYNATAGPAENRPPAQALDYILKWFSGRWDYSGFDALPPAHEFYSACRVEEEGYLDRYLERPEEFHDVYIGQPHVLNLIDPDGDEAEIGPSDTYGDGTYLFSVIRERNGPFEARYLPPFRFLLDTDPPGVESIELRGQEGVIEGVTNAAPQGIGFIGLRDKAGMDSIGCTLTGRDGFQLVHTIDSAEISGEDFAVPWPFGPLPGEQTALTLTLHLRDKAGNRTTHTLAFLHDREPPVPPGDLEEQLDLSYGPDKAIITFPSDWYGNEALPDPIVSFSASADVPIETSPEEGVLTLLWPDDYPPNQPVLINPVFYDRAGNGTPGTILLYSPARLLPGDFTLSGQKNLTFDDFSDEKGHHITLSPAGHPVGASTVDIDRLSGDVWLPLKGDHPPGLPFIHPRLDEHEAVSYRLTPKNSMDRANSSEEARLYLSGGEAPNHVPLLSLTPRGIQTREEHTFFGPMSSFDILIRDRESRDLQISRLRGVTGNTEKVLAEWTESSGKPLSYRPGEGDFADGRTYSIVLENHDSWEGGEGIGPSLTCLVETLTYDSSPPYVKGEPLFANPTGTAWGMRSVRAAAADDGSGIKRFWAELDDGERVITLEAENYRDGDYHEFPLPQGEYDLTFRLEDRLGNLSDRGKVYRVCRDGTPPELLSLAPSGEGTPYPVPLVKIRAQWRDAYGRPSSYRYRYAGEKNQPWMGGKIHDCPGDKLILDVSPRLFDPVEGRPYELTVILIDRGGNESSPLTMAEKIVFDFTPPRIGGVNWELAPWGEGYVSAQSALPSPEVILWDATETILTHRLIDGNDKEWNPSSLGSAPSGFYRWRIEATDETGRTTQREIPLLLDRDAPSPPGLTRPLPGTHPIGEPLRIGLTGKDGLSGIESFQLRWQGEGAPPAVIALEPSEAGEFRLDMPDLPGVALRLLGCSRDRAGNVSPWTELAAIRRVNKKEGVTIETPLYYGAGQTLICRWDYGGAEEISHYLLTLLGETERGGPTLVQTERSEPLLILSPEELSGLEDVDTLKLLIRPVNRAGRVLPIASSPPIRVDLEPPRIGQCTYPPIATPASCRVSWTGEDDTSLASVSLSLEDGEGHTLLTLKEPLLSGYTRDLAPMLGESEEEFDRLMIRLTLRDSAGNVTEELFGPVVYDRTEPSPFTVEDPGEYLNPLRNDLEFQWYWAPADPEAGETGFFWQLTDGGEIDPGSWNFTWDKEVRLAGSALAAYPDGARLVLMVKRDSPWPDNPIMFSNGVTLDRSAPVITGIELSSDSRDVAGRIYTGVPEIELALYGYDRESGIDRFVTIPGRRDGGEFLPLGPEESHSDQPLKLTLPEGETGKLITYRVICRNGAKAMSLPAFSPSLMYAPDPPELSRVRLDMGSRGAVLTWRAEALVPLVSQRIELYAQGKDAAVYEEDLPGGVRKADLPVQDLPDGTYRARLTLRDGAGRTRQSLSPPATLDRGAPGLTSLSHSTHVYDSLRVDLASTEPLAALTIALSSADRILLERECSFDTPRADWQSELGIPEQNGLIRELILSLRLKDRAGNWSEPINRRLSYDGTPPSTPVVERVPPPGVPPDLVGRSDRVDGITLSSHDPQSPLDAYRWALVQEGQGEPGWSDFVPLEPGMNRLFLKDLTPDGFALEEKHSYYLVMETRNRAGRLSSPGRFGPFKADLTPPQFEIYPSGSLLCRGTDSDRLWLFPRSGTIRLTPSPDETTPELLCEALLIDPLGGKRREILTLGSGSTRKEGIYAFTLEREGRHRLTLTALDAFGRMAKKELSLELYGDPQVTIPQPLTVRPGEARSLPYTDWVIPRYALEKIILTDGEGKEIGEAPWGGEIRLPPIKKDRPLALVLEDINGHRITRDFSVRLVPTREGTLLADETWSGSHSLTGRVTVPPGRRLTIEPGTVITAEAGPEYGTDQELIIEEGGRLVCGEGVVFRAGGDNAYWQGITLTGEITLKGVTIEQAQRGLTLLPGTGKVVLKGLSLVNNMVGVHVLHPNVFIEECRFSGNRHYALKEDGEGSLLLGTNHFDHNGIDHYRRTR